MFDALKAVLWSFLGIRSSQGYDRDRKQLKIVHVIAAGIVCCLFFVFSLYFLVKFLTAK